MALAVARGHDVVALVGRHPAQPGVTEVAGADDLGAAVVDGEVVTGLAGAGEGAAVGLAHRDGVARAGRHEPRLAMVLPRRGPEGISGEGRALGPDAGVEHTDDHATTGVLGATELRPDTVVAGQPEEVDRLLVVRHPAQPVAVHRHHSVGAGQGGRLLTGDLGGERVQADLVALVGGRSDPGGDRVLTLAQVRAVALRVRAVDVHVLTVERMRGVVAGHITVVGRDRSIGQRDDVVALSARVARYRHLRPVGRDGRLCRVGWDGRLCRVGRIRRGHGAEPEGEHGGQSTGKR